MNLNKYIKAMGEWLKGGGPASSKVISSRVRLARNVEKFPFSHLATPSDLQQIISRVEEAAKKSSYLANADIVKLKELSELDRKFLMERHLISHDLAKSKDGMVVIGDKEMLSIMVNEEDHIRIYGMDSGLQLSQTWYLVNKVDDELNNYIEYAVSPDWGYLTACPTNVGTGMRASVMIHLPALTLTKQINKVLKAVSQLGLAIRGLYGEGTEALGNLFQISNQVTLGQKEEEIVDNIERVTRQIIGHEENAEKLLLREAKEQIEDKVFRAYATLRYARVISTQEAIDLLSTVRLGVSMQILKGIKLSVLNELLVMIQPAHVQKISGTTLQPPQRDVKRAELIRKKLS